MNGDRALAAALCADIARMLEPTTGVDIAVCPPHILIPAVVDAFADSHIAVGAQDLDANANGAFTGQVSAAMIVDSNCRYVIIGHSERRTLYHETDQLVARKTKAALAAGLHAIVCLGETSEQRQSGATEQVIGRQLDAVLDGVLLDETGDETGATAMKNALIAYEPVWAIGSGVSATPQQAQQVHRFIRTRLAARDRHLAEQCRIIYGGSMKPDNAAQLLAQADIDGGLLGGAALNATDFATICKAAAA